MNIIGQKVKHKIWGLGVIKSLEGNIIEVSFDEGIKKMQFPEGFEKFLVFEDSSFQDYALKLLEEKAIKVKELQQEKLLEEERNKACRSERIKKAVNLIQKYPEYKETFATYYGEKIIVQTYDGNIDFDPNGYSDVVGAERFSYDDYIDVQIRSFHKTRGWFATCYHSIPLSFKGTIERKTKDNICFERIFVEGMYPDGLCFDGKEEHVWMSITAEMQSSKRRSPSTQSPKRER